MFGLTLLETIAILTLGIVSIAPVVATSKFIWQHRSRLIWVLERTPHCWRVLQFARLLVLRAQMQCQLRDRKQIDDRLFRRRLIEFEVFWIPYAAFYPGSPHKRRHPDKPRLTAWQWANHIVLTIYVYTRLYGHLLRPETHRETLTRDLAKYSSEPSTRSSMLRTELHRGNWQPRDVLRGWRGCWHHLIKCGLRTLYRLALCPLQVLCCPCLLLPSRMRSRVSRSINGQHSRVLRKLRRR